MEEQASPDVNQTISKEYQQEHETTMPLPKSGLSTLIGKDISATIAIFGQPVRIDPSAYGYEWWIFNNRFNHYVQVGVENGKVVTLFAIGKNVDITPFKIGQSIEELFSAARIEPGINLEYNGNSYRFELSEEDINTRPLVKMGNIYAQLNIDKFTGLLTSIRYYDAKTLILQHPYELVYRGELFQVQVNEEDWPKIEAGNRKQIFDLTNILRSSFKLEILTWDEEIAGIAYANSQAMTETGNENKPQDKFVELSERLKAAQIPFEAAVENEAASYPDAPAVIQGWLNSERHRKGILNKDCTHIGVGVFHKNFTQIFVERINKETP